MAPINGGVNGQLSDKMAKQCYLGRKHYHITLDIWWSGLHSTPTQNELVINPVAEHPNYKGILDRF